MGQYIFVRGDNDLHVLKALRTGSANVELQTLGQAFYVTTGDDAFSPTANFYVNGKVGIGTTTVGSLLTLGGATGESTSANNALTIQSMGKASINLLSDAGNTPSSEPGGRIHFVATRRDSNGLPPRPDSKYFSSRRHSIRRHYREFNDLGH